MVGESQVGVPRAFPVAPAASRGVLGTLWMLFLLLLINGSAAWTVTLAGWADGLEILPTVALGGLFIGWLLAIRRFSGPMALVLNLGYGAVWVGYLSARLIQAPTWSLKLQWLGYRLTVWVMEAARGGRGSDPLPFVVLMGALVWLAASASAWYSFRTIRAWRALLPAGLITFINAYYYLGPRPLTLFLITYLLGALLWLVTVHYEEQSYRWRLERVWFVPDLGVDILRAGLVVAGLTLALAWLLPAAGPSETVSRAWSEVSRPLRRGQETFNRLFSSLRSQRPAYVSPLGRTLPFGGPRRLSDTPVMDVKAQGPARYWRGVVYDVYTPNGWLSSGEDEQSRAPMTALTARPLWEGRAVVTQTFTVYLPGNTLIFAAQHPIAVSLPSIVQGRFTPQAHDLMMIRSPRPFGAQQTYEVISLVPVPDIESLRQAGTVYPEWVQRYLQLPANLDPRIRRLAERITAGYDNPYDKAAALEAWLRRNIRYNENIPAPPPGRDGVVYVLFDIRQGYCDYYASAMAVMAGPGHPRPRGQRLRAGGVDARRPLSGPPAGRPYLGGDLLPRLRLGGIRAHGCPASDSAPAASAYLDADTASSWADRCDPRDAPADADPSEPAGRGFRYPAGGGSSAASNPSLPGGADHRGLHRSAGVTGPGLLDPGSSPIALALPGCSRLPLDEPGGVVVGDPLPILLDADGACLLFGKPGSGDRRSAGAGGGTLQRRPVWGASIPGAPAAPGVVASTPDLWASMAAPASSGPLSGRDPPPGLWISPGVLVRSPSLGRGDRP